MEGGVSGGRAELELLVEEGGMGEWREELVEEGEGDYQGER